MEDDHVDRPGVEVRQRMKLTGTNSSIGLIVLIDYAHRTKFDKPDLCPGAVAIFDRYAPDGPRHKARRPLGLAERCSDALKKVRRVQKTM